MAHGAVGLLLTMVAGYWVLERAATHKGRLKQVGQLVGGLVIAVSVLGMVCRAWGFISASGMCPIGAMGKKGLCPFTRSAPTPAASDLAK